MGLWQGLSGWEEKQGKKLIWVKTNLFFPAGVSSLLQVRHYLEYSIQLWGPWYKKVMDLLEQVQRRSQDGQGAGVPLL